VGAMNCETLRACIQQTGMCLDETMDYLGGMAVDSNLTCLDSVHKIALENLISQIDQRVATALELKKRLGGSDFLWEIGSWKWPYPSVERKFYECLFARMP